jgi:hypothetical protein
MTVECGTDAIRRSNTQSRARNPEMPPSLDPAKLRYSLCCFLDQSSDAASLARHRRIKKAGRRPIEFELDRSALGKIVEDNPVSLSTGGKQAGELKI